ncbi:MAG: NAD-dependent epimerase/dehydratase family protein [Bdellovibrionaceae bacterium]|nr:NAD-dependent epimerase/dehydratase family protein [Pseudobdellovibrionaceae bacterium]MBX3033960.1 NAD-dependent epimerase/dehydratase family protein [Pseudobdellovibrionaceae bacterium]
MMSPAKKSILVIGGAGKFGSRLCDELAARGWHPVVVDNLSSGSGERVQRGPLVKFDARETPRLVRSLQEHAAVDLIHCALLEDSPATDPGILYEQHLKTTLSLLQALKEAKGRSLCVVSSGGRTEALLQRLLSDCATAYGFRAELVTSRPESAALERIFSTLG